MSWSRRRREFRGRQNHHDFHYAIFFFSELMFVNKADVANFYGVMKIAYTNTHLILGLIKQQGEDST